MRFVGFFVLFAVLQVDFEESDPSALSLFLVPSIEFCEWNRLLYKVEKAIGLNSLGNDVYILQKLISRSPFVKNVPMNHHFDNKTRTAVFDFQRGNKLGIFDEHTAERLVKLHTSDSYKDDKKIPSGYLYKVFVPVYRDRSIETTASLYDANMTLLHTFIARTERCERKAFGYGTPCQLSHLQLCSNGATPTGLMTFDLNSDENDPKNYGPYPVNRAVQGLKGNAEIIISDIRNGILLHTGEWDNWDPSKPMPDSHGCIHAHPKDVEKIWKILVSLGVKVRPNTFGKRPYPYVPQGILSVEQKD